MPNIRITPETYEKLKDYKKKTGISLAFAVKEAVDKLTNAQGKE